MQENLPERQSFPPSTEQNPIPVAPNPMPPQIVTVQSQQPPKKRNLLIPLLVLIFIVLLSAAGYYVWQMYGQKTNVADENVNETDVSIKTTDTNNEELETYTNNSYGYNFQHPSTYKLNELSDDTMVAFNFKGESASQESATDRVDLYFAVQSLDGKTLMDVAKVKREELFALRPQTTDADLKEKTLDSKPGYMFLSQSVMNETYIYLPLTETQYLAINYGISDPNSEGYQATVSKILDSFKF